MDSIIRITKGLTRTQSGIYITKNDYRVSYPDNGNEFCHALEESSFWFKHRNDSIITLLSRFPPRGTLYDIGGGNGFVAKILNSKGFDTVLIEPGSQGVRSAKKRGVSRIIKATFEACGFKPGTLSAVGLFDVIEHIKNDVKFLTRIRNAMHPNGRLYLTTPAYPWLWSVEDEFACHFRRYTANSLSDVLNKAGYKVEYKTFIFAALPIPVFLFRTLPSLFHIRKSSFNGNSKDHQIPKILASLNKIYSRFEFQMIKNSYLPFGSSIMAVAKPNPS